MSLTDTAVIFFGAYVLLVVIAGAVMALRPGLGGEFIYAEPGAARQFQIGVPNPPQRFVPGDCVRLARKGRPLARVGEELKDGRVRVWILEVSGGPQRWVGPKTVEKGEITNNYGPLDAVGIGDKIRDSI